jgi:uncharacterized MAPEG superfamily protein
MTIDNTIVLIAALMPVLTIGLAKASMAGKKRNEGGYDNHNPRDFAASQDGWRARAVAAQNNSFEALPLFIFAVLAAQMAGVDQARTDLLAMAFIGARIVYTALYLADVAAMRTVVWCIGLGLCIAIFSPTMSAIF